MSGSNIQFRQAAQLGAQKQVPISRQQEDLHEAITRAFEVAQVIEGAVRAVTGESLEQFITRVMTTFFERSEGTSVRIVPAEDMGCSRSGPLQIHDSAPKRDDPSRSGEIDHSIYPSGHPISLDVGVNSEKEWETAYKCMEQFGFSPHSIFGKRSSGRSASENRDRSELDCRSLADLACAILRNIWGIKAKNEIVCFFDHDKEESSRTLQSEEDLRKCLAAVCAGEPHNATLVIYTKGEAEILTIGRTMHETLLIKFSPTIVTEKIHSRIEALLEKAGYVRDAEYGRGCWRGKEDANFKVSVLSDVLRAAGIIVESDKLRADLRLKRRFV
ncbi:MAG: hypothetical protein HY298_11985 [Verrucomicrobia bacterium]|nr:hypothetical protein [Verrucomicrobiota bacterium]